MRVLSRRSNLPKAVACGYSEGAGFVVLTEPSPFVVPFCSACGARLVDAASASCVPGPRGCAHSAVLGWATNLPLAHTSLAHQQRPRRDGVGAATSPRDGVGMAWGLSLLGTGGTATPELAVRGPSAEAEKSARRRRRAAAEDSSRRRRRALPRAGDGCCRLVVSVTEAEAMALLWRTRDGTRIASTAAATTAGVAHRPLRCIRKR